jgi:hypothetical protein
MNLRAEISLAAIVQSMLDQIGPNPNPGGAETAVLVHVEFRDNDFFSQSFRYLFVRPRSYVSVFASRASPWEDPAESYQHIITHDSCWRSDGISPLWRDLPPGCTGVIEDVQIVKARLDPTRKIVLEITPTKLQVL